MLPSTARANRVPRVRWTVIVRRVSSDKKGPSPPTPLPLRRRGENFLKRQRPSGHHNAFLLACEGGEGRHDLHPIRRPHMLTLEMPTTTARVRAEDKRLINCESV